MASLIERARRDGTPLIENGTATFVWEGSDPPRLVGDWDGFGWREPSALMIEIEPGVWGHAMELPADAYLEYVYLRGDERVMDPYNPRTITNGIGFFNNFFAMPEAESTPLARARRGVPRGVVTRHVVENKVMVIGGKRVVHLYRPPVDEPCPLLVVFDGQDYLRRGAITRIADNLMAAGRIRPIAMALVSHGDQARYVEYNCSEATIGFLLRSVLPLAQEHVSLLDLAQYPGAFGVLGASMSGLMALYTGLRVPQIFGRVVSQSGAFGFDLRSSPPVIDDLVRHDPIRPLKIWMDVGRFEWLVEPNRSMHALLRDRGYDVAYREYNGGHNYTSWKNDVWRGLEAVFNF